MAATLVLLPGMDGTGELFAPLVDALGADVSTVVVRYPDLPLNYVEHLEIARTFLPPDRPYVVLGESFSGPIAVTLAADPPPGMLGYVLCASFVCCPRPILKLLRPTLDLLPPQRVPSVLANYFLLGQHGSEAIRLAHRRVVQNVSPRTLTARLNAIANVDVRDELVRAQVPGLYLRATEDRMVPPAAALTFARLASNARVVDIEGPHFLLQTNPTVAAGILKAFMAQTGQARAPRPK
jgi:pimeloyl-ACP methyl ester carboxylesterase